jgi:hypothetical protein
MLEISWLGFARGGAEYCLQISTASELASALVDGQLCNMKNLANALGGLTSWAAVAGMS